jgi:hypothetical protein
MKFFNKISPEWALRLSLGAMYLYSGIDILRHPSAWTWAVNTLPAFVREPIVSFGVLDFLFYQGIGEVLLAIVFLAWFMPKVVVRYAGLLSGVEMVLILFLVGIDAITFRDIGLAGAGFALYLMLVKKNNYGYTS